MVEQNDKVFQMRVSEDFLRQLDDWRRTQPDIPPRAETVRRLVELGLIADARERQHKAASTPSQLERDAAGNAVFQRRVIG